jgi:hypothetical protein
LYQNLRNKCRHLSLLLTVPRKLAGRLILECLVHNTMYEVFSSLQIYRMTQKSVNLKHFFVLTGMFRFKPANHFLEWYHSGVSCELNMEDLISKNVCKFRKL